MVAIIETKGLTKDYVVGSDMVHALADADIVIDAGEMVAVMGPSGSGKSTCMNLLGCLDTPTRGSYSFDGVEVSSLNRDRLAAIRNAKIGFVFQSFNLLGRATALHNVEMPLIYGSTPAGNRREKAVEALSAVGLADRMDHTPAQLSGGQMQRVAIARALVNDPALLLADEPTGALDTRTGIEIMALFQKLNGTGITVVLVTHEPEVARFAQRILRFRDGRLVSDDPQAPDSAIALLADLDADSDGAKEAAA
jgi:putative ABC transport system ATP-binding protein